MKQMKQIFIGVFAIALVFGISWGITVGLFYLACIVFNWAGFYNFFNIAPIVFSWKNATAIWALLTIFKLIFGSGSSSKK
jgi:hypothetical protein